MGTADGRGIGLREPEMFHFPRRNEVPHRSSDVFDRDFGVRTVLIEQIDGVYAEAPQRLFGNLTDSLRATIESARSGLTIGIETVAELGCDDNLALERLEGFADEPLVGEGTIDLGGIEERHAALDGAMKKGNHFLMVANRLVTKRHAHAAKADGGDFKAAVT